jgi:outer membrane protein assembly factor BamD (BamD/ComL family)
MNFRRIVFLAGLASVAAWPVTLCAASISGVGTDARYATDAYPGFDSEDELLKPSKKEPKFFAFVYGPKKDNPADQFEWSRQCESEGEWRAARKGYDALVREWPTSPEAVKAQKAYADLLLNHDLAYEDAFLEYRYLLDFYSSECDFSAVADTMYKVAELMREEGKTIMFFRFSNTVDVRRAYEAVVLRAPGAKFVPQAMLTIAQLREDEQKYAEAVQVYENLRSLRPDSPEAMTALHREGKVRMKLLEMHGYNRDRVRDTIAFLRSALRGRLDDDIRTDFEAYLAKTVDMEAEEAYKAAKFYDSRTRTLRSAITAYERFLKDYPSSSHADEVRARIEILKEGKQQ